jgi:hypothetical protein
LPLLVIIGKNQKPCGFILSRELTSFQGELRG